mmetsp:Transcript_29184/g.93799  ORF Transcript_29184/g.93799 Transcript_29184/m.93799 type:complete len:532 (-) Transcript_29184:78-1673(-)
MKNSEVPADNLNDPCFQHSHNSAFSRFPRKNDSSDASVCAGEQFSCEKLRLKCSNEAMLLCSFALSEAMSNSKRLHEGDKDTLTDAINTACDSALKIVLDPQSIYGSKSTVLSRAELTDHAVAIHLLESLIGVNPNVTQLESSSVKELIAEVRKADVYYHESVVQMNQAKKQLEYLLSLQEKKLKEPSLSDFALLKTRIRRQQSIVDETSKTMLERWELLCLFVKSKVVRIVLDRLAQECQIRLLRGQTSCFVDQCRKIQQSYDSQKKTWNVKDNQQELFISMNRWKDALVGSIHSELEKLESDKLEEFATVVLKASAGESLAKVRPASREEIHNLKSLSVCPSDSDVTRVQSCASQEAETPDEDEEGEEEVRGFTRSVSSSSKASTTCSSREEYWGDVVMLVREKNDKLNRPGKVELGGLAERRYKKEAWLGSMNSMLCGVHTIPLSAELFPACSKTKSSKACELESFKLKQGCNRTRSVGPPMGPEEQSTENKDSKGEGSKGSDIAGQKRSLAEACEVPCEVSKRARED